MDDELVWEGRTELTAVLLELITSPFLDPLALARPAVSLLLPFSRDRRLRPLRSLHRQLRALGQSHHLATSPCVPTDNLCRSLSPHPDRDRRDPTLDGLLEHPSEQPRPPAQVSLSLTLG